MSRAPHRVGAALPPAVQRQRVEVEILVDEAQARILEAGAVDGVFHVDDAEALGITKHHRHQAAAVGRWRRVAHRTWVINAHTASTAQPVVVALVATRRRGAATGLAAAALRGWDVAPTVSVAVDPRRGHRPEGVHRTRLDPQELDEVKGFRCLSTGATLVATAALLDDDEWEQVLESALRLGHTTLASTAALAGPGVAGDRIGRVLERRGEVRPTRSWLETRVVQLCRLCDGIPEPERGFEIWDSGRFVAEVDLSWPALEGYLECDGRAFHTRDEQFVADRWRETQIVSLLYEFDEASRFGTMKGTGIADWPVSYAEIEPYYTQAEWEIGISGPNLKTPLTTGRKLAQFITTLDRRHRTLRVGRASELLIPAGAGRPGRLWTSTAPSTRPAS